jgi:THO complex subunit 2
MRSSSFQALLDPVTKKPTEPDPLNPVRVFWFKLLRLYFLPSLPLIRGNAVCTVEIWNIFRQYEPTARWKLYGEWKTSTYNSHPELRIRQVQADRESKGILRRLSHQTIDTLSGTVAKLAHSNPCIFFANAVNQIMAYDNLAGVVIQALRYVTTMGFDVLVYIILDALSNPYKNRVKDDGVNISDWLQSRFGCVASLHVTHNSRSRIVHRHALSSIQCRSVPAPEIRCTSTIQRPNDGNSGPSRTNLENGWH